MCSIQQQPGTGNMVVAGRTIGTLGGSSLVALATVMLLDPSLDHIANIQPSSVNTSDLAMKAIVLPDGTILHMVNSVSMAGMPSAYLICYSANLSQVLWWYAYTTTACDELHFDDIAYQGDQVVDGRAFVVGHMGPQGGSQRAPFLLAVDVLPAAQGGNPGNPAYMASYSISTNPLFQSRFNAVTVGPSMAGGSGSTVWIGGTSTYTGSSVSMTWLRVLGVDDGAGGAKLWDHEFGLRMVPVPGGIHVDSGGSCGGGAWLPRVQLGGSDLTVPSRALHARIDPSTPTVMHWNEYGTSAPPYSRFNAMVLGTPTQFALIGGQQRASTAPGAPFNPYFVMTDSQGHTPCSPVMQEVPGVPQTAPRVLEACVRRLPGQDCAGASQWVPFIVTRSIGLYIEESQVVVVGCASCPEDLTGDHAVDGADLGVLLASWGPCENFAGAADLNSDGMVSGADLGALLAAWGQTCP